MGLRKSVTQQREWSTLPQNLQQALQQRLQAQPLQIRCATRDKTLLVLAEHLLHIEPDPEQIFWVLELEVKELLAELLQTESAIQITEELPIQLLLRIAGYQHPYASRKIRFEPETPTLATPLPVEPFFEEPLSPVVANPEVEQPVSMMPEMLMPDVAQETAAQETAAQETTEPTPVELDLPVEQNLMEQPAEMALELNQTEAVEFTVPSEAALEAIHTEEITEEIYVEQISDELRNEISAAPAEELAPTSEAAVEEIATAPFSAEPAELAVNEPIIQPPLEEALAPAAPAAINEPVVEEVLLELPEVTLEEVSEAVEPEAASQPLQVEPTETGDFQPELEPIEHLTLAPIPPEPLTESISLVDLLLGEEERSDVDPADIAALPEPAVEFLSLEQSTPEADEPADVVDADAADEEIEQTASIEPPRIEPPTIEPPKIDEPKIEPPEIKPPEIDEPKIDAPEINELEIESPQIDAPAIDEPTIEPPQIDAQVEPVSLDEVLSQAIPDAVSQVAIELPEDDASVRNVALDLPAVETQSEDLTPSEPTEPEFTIADPWTSEEDELSAATSDVEDVKQNVTDVETVDELITVNPVHQTFDQLLDQPLDEDDLDNTEIDQLEPSTNEENEPLLVDDELNLILRKIGVSLVEPVEADLEPLTEFLAESETAPQTEYNNLDLTVPSSPADEQAAESIKGFITEEHNSIHDLDTEPDIAQVSETENEIGNETLDLLEEPEDAIDAPADHSFVEQQSPASTESEASFAASPELADDVPDNVSSLPASLLPEPETRVDQQTPKQSPESSTEAGLAIDDLREYPPAQLTSDSIDHTVDNTTANNITNAGDSSITHLDSAEKSQRSPWSASNMVLGSAIGSFVLVGGLYALTRPCVVGTCDQLERAQELSQEATQTAQATESALEVVEAHKKLSEASNLLSTIPTWSPHYKDAQALLNSYKEQAALLGQVVGALEKANTAAQRSQNPPHPLQEWREIQWLWREVIEQLEAIPANNSLYPLVQRKLEEYRVNLTTINQRVGVEQQAQDRIAAARQAEEMATSKAEAAKSAENWQEAVALWTTAIQQLKQIPAGTNVFNEAAQLLSLYQPKLAEASTRQTQEQTAAKAYSQAITYAEEARRLEQQNQWTQAASYWRDALTYAQQVPGESVYYSQVQPLISSYTQTLQQAQGNSQRSTAIQTAKPNFDRACEGQPQICTYTLSPQAARVQFTSAYDQAVEQLINRTQQQESDFPPATVNQINELLRALATISEATQVPVELYNSNGTKLGVYAPTLSGYVPQQ